MWEPQFAIMWGKVIENLGLIDFLQEENQR